MALEDPNTQETSDMQQRRRFKQTQSFHDRLALFAQGARERAADMPAGPQKDDLLCKARQADTASHLDEWANSAGLQSPE
jgi:hypothetical protein